MRLYFAFAAALLAGQLAAQPAPGRGAAPRSAEVSPDGRVTFRLSAPKASDVRVNGNWPEGRGLPMTRDESGTWTATTAPLRSEIWTYTLTVDGTTMLDPGNYHVVRDGTRYMNTVLVRGPEAALYQAGSVPHGSVAAVWYPSTALKTGRRMLVYTPPGYEASGMRYPVLYLFHGGGGDEEAWRDMGSANVIMDNLIAQRKARPMIVVMPNANWNRNAALDPGDASPAAGARSGAQPPAAPGAAAGQDYLRAEREIVDDIVRFVERNYRALPNRENRALAGLSMGGGISINVGLKRLDTFAAVGQFSSGMFGGVAGYAPFDVEKVSPGFLKDPAATNRKLRLLYFSCGSDDPRMPHQTRTAEELRSRKIDLVFESYPGGHEWSVWRKSLADMAARLFRQDGNK